VPALLEVDRPRDGLVAAVGEGADEAVPQRLPGDLEELRAQIGRAVVPADVRQVEAVQRAPLAIVQLGARRDAKPEAVGRRALALLAHLLAVA